jgi:hypothetical protein
MTGAWGSQSTSLTCAEDYFLKVLKPNKESFFGAPSTFASALNLATTLYHFHEWLFEEYKSKLESELNSTFSGKGAFWQSVPVRAGCGGKIGKSVMAITGSG